MDSPTKSVSQLSPVKGTPSTRVIESLHRELDELKSELLNTKNRNEELSKANDIVKKRRDQLVEKVSNLKHENDTIGSLLQRKARRVHDLEERLNEMTCSSDDLKMKVKTLQTRCEKLQENESSSVSEHERIKIAYDIIVAGQKEYRSHYTAQIKRLKDQLESYIKEKDALIQKNISLINKSDATIYRSIKSITLRSNEIEEKYEKRDKELSDRVSEMGAAVKMNSNDTNALLSASKDLFEEIATTLDLDKKSLLETYMAEGETRINPFMDAEESPRLRTAVSSGENVPIIVKKRGVRASRDSTAVTTEDRVRTLSRELNNSIPQSDRLASVEPSRSKSARRSRIISKDERLLSGELSADSARSKLFDKVVVSTSTAASDFGSRQSSQSKKEEPAETLDAADCVQESLGKKKRRRRKRNRNKITEGVASGKSGDDAAVHSGEEFS